MSEPRPELLRAVARSEELIRDLPRHFLHTDAETVPVGAFLRENETAHDLLHPFILLARIDELVRVLPMIYGSMHREQRVELTSKGWDLVNSISATSAPPAGGDA